MSRQPVLVFSVTEEQMNTVYERALSRQIRFSLFTEDLFQTDNDEDNRAAVKARQQEALRIGGLALWAEKKSVEKVLKGVTLHR